ncbi:MAG TPA: hypothetical protein VIT62_00830 [Lysobacter sp.]
MTSRQAGSDSSQDPRDVAEPDAFSTPGLGAALVAQVDLDAITALIQGLPTASLLEQLDAIVSAMDSADPARARRRVGWLGRLIGHDLVAQAQVDPVEQRVRVALSFAQTLAIGLASQLVDLQASAGRLQRQLGLLDATVSDARTSQPEDERSLRRLVHLDLIAASWTTTLAHVAMVRDHARRMMERHEQVRDVLVPLWRQHAIASAAGTKLHSDARPDRFAQLQRELRIGLASLHDSAESLPSQHTDTTTAAPKEPLP